MSPSCNKQKLFEIVAILSGVACCLFLYFDKQLFSNTFLDPFYVVHSPLDKGISRPADQRCENLLTNLTSGTWIETSHDEARERELDEILLRFWRKRGILNQSWRKDGLCGYHNYNTRPENSTWERVGSWCDPHSDKPCCSDLFKGRCSEPAKDTCECFKCVDARKYKHDVLMNWQVRDDRCSWSNFSAVEACNVIEKSPYSDIYYVGDSFIRNMFLTMLMLLSNDPVRGAWSNNMTVEQRELCVSGQMNFWKECRQLSTNLKRVMNPEQLCGGREPKFNLTLKPYYNPDFGRKFYDLVEGLIGKEGSLVVLSVGFHMQCTSSKTIEQYLGPAVDRIHDYYYANKTKGPHWPQIFLLLPMPTALLKPPRYFGLQNDYKMAVYASQMKTYCKRFGIPVFDFKQLGKYVHSFDGTHYGLGVNLLKNQILLNYISATA